MNNTDLVKLWKVTKIVSMLFVFLVTLVGSAVAFSQENSGPLSNIEVSQIKESIRQIPNLYLRDSAYELLAKLQKYEKSSSDDLALSSKISLYSKAWSVFYYYERHQNTSGHEKAMEVRPVVLKLLEITADELEWLEERQKTSPKRKVIMTSLAKMLSQLKSAEPIPRATAA